MTPLSPDIIACAIVAAGRVCDQDPEEAFVKQLTPSKWYALWLLASLFPDASKPAMGRCLGYNGSSGKTIHTPSGRIRCGFNGHKFERAWIEFTRLLERFAPEALEAESPSPSPPVSLPPAVPIRTPANPPPSARPARKPALPLILDTDPESARIAEKARLRSMIAQAFANTPGAVKV